MRGMFCFALILLALRAHEYPACTAVVTEISYHDKDTIDADVSFLSEAEWKQELAILLTDLVDEDGNLKRSTDMKSDAGIAWQKVIFHSIVRSNTF